jgi:hypothetical protein
MLSLLIRLRSTCWQPTPQDRSPSPMLLPVWIIKGLGPGEVKLWCLDAVHQCDITFHCTIYFEACALCRCRSKFTSEVHSLMLEALIRRNPGRFAVCYSPPLLDAGKYFSLNMAMGEKMLTQIALICGTMNARERVNFSTRSLLPGHLPASNRTGKRSQPQMHGVFVSRYMGFLFEALFTGTPSHPHRALRS